MIHIGEDGRSIKVWAKLRQSCATDHDARATILRIVHLLFDYPKLAFVDHGADVCIRIRSIAYAQSLRFPHASIEKRLINFAIHIAPLHREACLTCIHKGAPDSAARRDINVRVFEHQHRIFSTQFQNNWKQARSCHLRDPLSG